MGLFSRRAPDNNGEPDTPAKNEAASEPSPPTSTVGFETVLGATSTLEGELSSEGNVRLDGEFKGTLHITGNVLVGEPATIYADIDARNISIAGSVRGNVTGNKVQLLRTGRIWGDINARALTTEEGAFIEGKITMRDHDATTNTPKSAAADADNPETRTASQQSASPHDASTNDNSDHTENETKADPSAPDTSDD